MMVLDTTFMSWSQSTFPTKLQTAYCEFNLLSPLSKPEELALYVKSTNEPIHLDQDQLHRYLDWLTFGSGLETMEDMLRGNITDFSGNLLVERCIYHITNPSIKTQWRLITFHDEHLYSILKSTDPSLDVKFALVDEFNSQLKATTKEQIESLVDRYYWSMLT